MAAYTEFFQFLNAMRAAGIDWSEGLSAEDIRNVRGWAHTAGPDESVFYTDDDGVQYFGRKTNADMDKLLGLWRQKHVVPGNMNPGQASTDKPGQADLSALDKTAQAKLHPQPVVVGPEKKPDAATDKPLGNPVDSGRAKDAKDELNTELDKQRNGLGEADVKLANAILDAQATTDKSKTALKTIKNDITESILNDDKLNLDTLAGQKAFLKYLQGKVKEVQDTVGTDQLSAQSNAAMIDGLRAALSADQGGDQNTGQTGEPPAGAPQNPAPGAVDPGLTNPSAPGLGLADPGLGAFGLDDPGLGGLGLDDPGLGDFGLAGLGADPLAGLASALPGMLGGLPAGGMSPGGDPLSGLSGAAAPFADLAGKIADAAGGDSKAKDGTEFSDEAKDGQKGAESKFTDGDKDTDGDGGTEKGKDVEFGDGEKKADGEALSAGTTDGQPVSGAAPAAEASGPASAPTTVTLPDGSTVDAQTAQAKAATEAFATGTAADAAWSAQGVQLPPPGTAVTHPVDPSKLHPGCLGMFKDHYAWALSPTKALADGQVVSLSSVAQQPGFLGWFDPMAQAGAGSSARTVAAAAPVPAAVGAPAPVAAAS